jgi:transposase
MLMSKKDILMENGTYNKNYKNVKALKFIDDRFFDPMDIAQVKYEMLKEVERNGVTITDAADSYGFSRTAYYSIKEAFSTQGIKGLIPEKTGPKSPHKLTREYQKLIDEWVADNPSVSSNEIAERLNQNGAIHVSKRTIERYRAKKKL